MLIGGDNEYDVKGKMAGENRGCYWTVVFDSSAIFFTSSTVMSKYLAISSDSRFCESILITFRRCVLSSPLISPTSTPCSKNSLLQISHIAKPPLHIIVHLHPEFFTQDFFLFRYREFKGKDIELTTIHSNIVVWSCQVKHAKIKTSSGNKSR